MPTRKLPVVQSSLNADGTRAFVFTADVHGRFARARVLVFVALIALWAALPWIPVGGHPAVFLDVEDRAFYLFGATFNAQDIWMTVFLLTGAAFTLVAMTAVVGRAWCGWACPQTVFLDGVYRRLERLVGGPREKRMRRAHGGWTFDRVWRGVVLHALYAIVSVAIAHVVLSYFVSLRGMFVMMRERPAEHPEAFAVVASLSAVLYGNFAWFREQFCVVMCPYGRLQSVLVDDDSLVVGYDAARGEPRGKATAKSAGEAAGDCVDCKRCVVVCPTGIDIRNGLQMDCIACTACIDACDDIMDKLGRPRGLVRYDSMNGFAGRTKRFVRPRILVYAGLFAVGGVASALAFRGRTDFEANVVRAGGAPYVVEDGVVRDGFEIHLVNKLGRDATFVIEPDPASAPPGTAFVVPLGQVKLAPLESREAPIFASVPRAAFAGDFTLRVRVSVVGTKESRVVSVPFLGPAHGGST